MMIVRHWEGDIMSMQIDFSGVGDAELLSRLQRLVRVDRSVSAKLLVHLAEVDARKLHLEQAYSSLHEYCVKGLGMSDAEAYLRTQAAKLGRRFPLVIERIESGELNLSSIKLMGPHLTLENHVELLDRVRGMRKREVEKLVAELAPQPDVPARMRRLPSLGPVASAPAVAPLRAQESATQPSAAAATAAPAFTLEMPRPRASTTPLSPGRFKLELTLDQDGHDKLEQLREMLRHQIPDGDLKRIVTLALSKLHEETLRRRAAHASKPRKRAAVAAEAPKPSRVIPRAVRREVFARDGGRCTFVSDDSQRCEARGFIEVHHHDVPFARGGAATVENLRLACRAHNGWLAERDYGASYMQGRISNALTQRREQQAVLATW
jgi:hypothetical protein